MMALFAAPAFAQWAPPYDRNYSAEPLCNEQREQIKVRLLETTKFLMDDDVPAGTVLYGVRVQGKELRAGRTATAYCQLYRPKTISFWSGAKRQEDERKREQGFEQCFQDLDNDGFFDEASQSLAFYVKADKYSYKLPYEPIEATGMPELGCPRVAPKNAAMTVSAKFWNALTPDEMAQAKAKATGPIDVVPVTELGVVVDAQRIDKSTAGSSFARDGAAAAEQRYTNKALAQGNYSQLQAAQARNFGAALAALFDVPADKAFLLRYTLRDHSGELVTIDKIDSGEGFTHAVGSCLAIPSAAKLPQALCEGSVDGLRTALLGTVPASPTTAPPAPAAAPSATPSSLASKEQKLLELKRLFERGLISEKVYTDEQRAILSLP